MKNIRIAGYGLIGFLGTLILLISAGIIGIYGFILKVILQPSVTSGEIMDTCGKFQDWIDKKAKIEK